MYVSRLRTRLDSPVDGLVDPVTALERDEETTYRPSGEPHGAVARTSAIDAPGASTDDRSRTLTLERELSF